MTPVRYQSLDKKRGTISRELGSQCRETSPPVPHPPTGESRVSLVGFKAENHPQQVDKRGADDAIDNRATPPEWFAEMHARFRFTLDAAASAENHKLPRYFTIADNGLEQSWAGERVWCNPPFSNLGAWAWKAWREINTTPLIVMLVPANRTEQPWWQDSIEPHRDKPGSFLRVEFIRHRRRFIAAGNSDVQRNERPPFGVCLLIWENPMAVPGGSAR